MQRHMVAAGAEGQAAEWQQSVCAACRADRTKRQRHQLQMSSEYLRATLSAHPLHTQMTSVMEVSVHLWDRVNGYAHSDLRSDNVLLAVDWEHALRFSPGAMSQEPKP